VAPLVLDHVYATYILQKESYRIVRTFWWPSTCVEKHAEVNIRWQAGQEPMFFKDILQNLQIPLLL
jgi:hypothetical protein